MGHRRGAEATRICRSAAFLRKRIKPGLNEVFRRELYLAGRVPAQKRGERRAKGARAAKSSEQVRLPRKVHSNDRSRKCARRVLQTPGLLPSQPGPWAASPKRSLHRRLHGVLTPAAHCLPERRSAGAAVRAGVQDRHPPVWRRTAARACSRGGRPCRRGPCPPQSDTRHGRGGCS